MATPFDNMAGFEMNATRFQVGIPNFLSFAPKTILKEIFIDTDILKTPKGYNVSPSSHVSALPKAAARERASERPTRNI